MQSHSSSLEKYSWRPKVAFALGSQELKEQLFSLDCLEELLTFADVLDNQVLTEFDSELALSVLSDIDILLTGWGSQVSMLLLNTVPEQLTHEQYILELQKRQNPRTGLVPEHRSQGAKPEDARRFGADPENYHALSVGYALDLLGSEFRHPIHDVTGMSATDLLQRLDALPWQKEAWESGAWVDAWGTAAYWNLARGA